MMRNYHHRRQGLFHLMECRRLGASSYRNPQLATMGDEELTELMLCLRQQHVNKTVAEARETARGKRLEAKALKAG